MYLLYDVFKCLSNCFKSLGIFYVTLHFPYLLSVFFEIFKKINSILCLKLFIYLLIFHMLDQMLNQIMKVLTQYFFFQNNFSTFFPFDVSFIFPFLFLIFNFLILDCSLMSFIIIFLHTFLNVFDCTVKNFGFEKVCLKLKE